MSQSRLLAVATWLLRVAILIHAVALFAIVFKNHQTQFGNVLFLELFAPRVREDFFGFQVTDPYIAALHVEYVTVSVYLLLGIAVFCQPFRSRWLLYPVLAGCSIIAMILWPFETTLPVFGLEIQAIWLGTLAGLCVMLWSPLVVLLLLMFAYAITEALSGTIFGGYRFHDWTIYSNTLRWGTPLVLLFLAALPGGALFHRFNVALARDLLRILIALVFLFHGLQAWLESPLFIDLILGTFRRLFDIGITESGAVTLLKIIAIVDFIVALAVVILPRPILTPGRIWPFTGWDDTVRRWVLPSLLIWLSFWGLITAASRMTALGMPGGLSQYPEMLIRASHYLGPLAAWALIVATCWPKRSDEAPGETGPPGDHSADERDRYAPAPLAGEPHADPSREATPAPSELPRAER